MDVPDPTSNAAAGHPIRKRMRRREGTGAVRFITFSCERRLPILGASDARDIFAGSLRAARERFGFELFAWVLMPEHVHMLLRPAAGARLDRALLAMKLSAAQRLLRYLRIARDPLLERVVRPDGAPRLWQKGGGFDRNVRSDSEFQREVRYIHRNPVAGELVQRPTDWAWSSARWWTARQEGREMPAGRNDIPCDWPPGDERAWAMWEGYA